jgi:hypothetical protein
MTEMTVLVLTALTIGGVGLAFAVGIAGMSRIMDEWNASRLPDTAESAFDAVDTDAVDTDDDRETTDPQGGTV